MQLLDTISGKGGITTKKIIVGFLSIFIALWFTISAEAAGLFGPPEPIGKKEGGLRTGIAYQDYQDRFKNGSDYIFKQRVIYSEASYAARSLWEIYGRIGIADLKIIDAYQNSSVLSMSKNDFEDNWSFFGTLGGKLFHPAGDNYGIGIFFQASHALSDYNDSVSGIFNGIPFLSEIKVKNLWDASMGIGLQAKLFSSTKLYGGPYLSHAEAEVSSSPATGSSGLTSGDNTIQNKTKVGGFVGFAFPLYKMFNLNIEANCTQRLSIGAAITFSY